MQAMMRFDREELSTVRCSRSGFRFGFPFGVTFQLGVAVGSLSSSEGRWRRCRTVAKPSPNLNLRTTTPERNPAFRTLNPEGERRTGTRTGTPWNGNPKPGYRHAFRKFSRMRSPTSDDF